MPVLACNQPRNMRCAAASAVLTLPAVPPRQPPQVDLSQPKEAAAVKDQFSISLPEAGETSCSVQARGEGSARRVRGLPGGAAPAVGSSAALSLMLADLFVGLE